jgi:hypothetical protein
MRTDFVGHATLLVHVGSLKLLSDPWWAGPAYRGQWYPYPLPVPERYDLADLDAVYISHAHEDHLHPATLREVVREAPRVQAIIPKRYDPQMRDYLRRLGFQRIREVASGSSFTLRNGRDVARLTVLTHMDDSMLGIEADGQVLLNANDALHAARRELIDEYCTLLRRRFPRLDYLFCGFGGASYFPNCISAPGKDDVAVARAREEFFLRNFAWIAERLRPRHAIPFAAHFVLPDERTWWMSEVRLRMDPPAVALRRMAPSSGVQFHDLQPGDSVDRDGVHVSESPYPIVPQQVRDAVLARYPEGHRVELLEDNAFDALVEEIGAAVQRKVTAGQSPSGLDAVVVMWDHPARIIEIQAGAHQATVRGRPATDLASLHPDVIFETRSDLLRSTMRSTFGRDLITIGYAARIRLRSVQEFSTNPHERLLDLLAPTPPRWRQRLRQHPVRTLGFVLRDPSMVYALRQKLRRSRATARADAEPRLYAIGDWATIARAPEQ